ncbi:MAG: dihydropteroate synthase [Myxococcota bacterium]
MLEARPGLSPDASRPGRSPDRAPAPGDRGPARGRATDLRRCDDPASRASRCPPGSIGSTTSASTPAPRRARTPAELVVVHSLSRAERARPRVMSLRQVLDSIEQDSSRRGSQRWCAGVAEERLIIDPGMGFFLGRDPRASVAVLQRIASARARFGRSCRANPSCASARRERNRRDRRGDAFGGASRRAHRRGLDPTHDVRALCATAFAIEAALGQDGID